jgi:hypothetical protein
MEGVQMHGTRRLSDAELAEAKRNRAAGEASLACEGMYLTPEETALFDRFERDRIPHQEARRQLIEFSRARRFAKANAAE